MSPEQGRGPIRGTPRPRPTLGRTERNRFKLSQMPKRFLLPMNLLPRGWSHGGSGSSLHGSARSEEERTGPWGRAAGLTVAGHAQRQAFLQAAVLAAVAVGAVDQAVPLPGAGVAGVVLLAAPEKTLRGTGRRWESARRGASPPQPPSSGRPRAHLAAFAGDNAVVDPRGLVSADLARDHFDLGCSGGERGVKLRGLMMREMVLPG